MKLEGRTANVTGSSRGIGRAVAIALAREGARVMVNGRNREAESIASLIQAAGGAVGDGEIYIE